jgi:hypothetical protein
MLTPIFCDAYRINQTVFFKYPHADLYDILTELLGLLLSI